MRGMAWRRLGFVFLFAFAAVAVMTLAACSGGGEHDEGGGEGEESGDELTLTERYDGVRYGARLVLGYDEAANAFTGTVENTTGAVLRRVRVEVHLSNGVELGPTAASDLAPGERRAVRLEATARRFDGWSAHAEVGQSEGGGGGEHGPEGEKEHSG